MSSGLFKDLFSSRSMISAIEEWKTPQTFILNTFFKEIKEHATKYVEANVYTETRRIAPFIDRRGTGQTVEKQGYTKFIYEPPYIKPRENIEPSDLHEALITENPYSAVDPASRFIEIRNKCLWDLDRMIERTEERMAVQALWDGALTIVDENGSTIETITMPARNSNLAFSAGTVWSTSATATPIDDIRDGSRLIAQYTGLLPDVAVHGATAADEFLACSQVQDYLSRNVYAVSDLEMARNDAQNMGVTLMCVIEGVRHYRYDEWYIDPSSGSESTLVTADKVLLGSSRARSVRHYGAIETLAGPGLVRARRWPKFYDSADNDPEVYGVQIHSAPIPITHQPNAFSVITT